MDTPDHLLELETLLTTAAGALDRAATIHDERNEMAKAHIYRKMRDQCRGDRGRVVEALMVGRGRELEAAKRGRAGRRREEQVA